MLADTTTQVTAALGKRLADLEATPIPPHGLLMVGLDDASMFLVADGGGYHLGGYPRADIRLAFVTHDRDAAQRTADRVAAQLRARGDDSAQVVVMSAHEARKRSIDGLRASIAMLRPSDA